jgi:hypothetical protein
LPFRFLTDVVKGYDELTSLHKTYNKFRHSVSHDVAEEYDWRDDEIYGADDVGKQLCCDVVRYTVQALGI